MFGGFFGGSGGPFGNGRNNPFAEMDRMMRQMDQHMNDIFGNDPFFGAGRGQARPQVGALPTRAGTLVRPKAAYPPLYANVRL